MKIAIIYDDKYLNKIEKGNIILTTDQKLFMELKEENFNIEYINLYNFNDQRLKTEATNILFSQLNDIFSPFINGFYLKITLPIMSMIISIKETMLKYEIDTIEIFGGTDYCFLSYNFAEWESSKQILYKREWMLNYFIFNYFKNGYKIVWFNKTNRLFLYIINYLRNNILFFLSIIKNIKKGFVYTPNTNKHELIKSNKKIIFIVIDLNIQINHLKSIVRELNQKYKVVYISSRKFKELSKNNSIVLDELTIHEIINIFKKIISLGNNIKYNKVKYKILNKEFKISEKEIFESLKYNIFIYNCKKKRYINLISELDILNKKSLFINNKTFGGDAFLDKEIAGIFNKKLLTFQYVNMQKRFFPDYSMTDKLYVYSKDLYNYYRSHTNKFQNYDLTSFQSVKKNYNFNASDKKKNIKMTIFTQPDQLHNKYIELIKKVVEIMNKYNLKNEVNIKLHYRQARVNDFVDIIKKCNYSIKIYQNEKLAGDLIMNSDIVVSISSSVIFEAIMYGVPTVLIDIDNSNSDNSWKPSFLHCDINYLINSYEQLLDFLKNPRLIFKDYNIRRDKWFEKNMKYDNHFDLVTEIEKNMF